jgi:hypothetical protein
VAGWAAAVIAASKKAAKPAARPGVGNGMMRTIRSCYRGEVIYTRQVRITWKFPGLALLTVVALLSGGCGGLRASRTISPLDFLLPGILRADPPQTNAPVVLVKSLVKNPVEVASIR